MSSWFDLPLESSGASKVGTGTSVRGEVEVALRQHDMGRGRGEAGTGKVRFTRGCNGGGGRCGAERAEGGVWRRRPARADKLEREDE